MNISSQRISVRQAVEIAVHLSLIFIIAAWCFQILRPFISLLAWGAIIAVSVYTPFLKLRKMLGGRDKWAVVIIAILGVSVVLVPSWMFVESFIGSAQTFYENANDASFAIKPPPEDVKAWPLIGEKTYQAWSEASANLEVFLEEHHDQFRSLATGLLSKAANMGLGILLFVASILVAAAFLANAESLQAGMLRLTRRIAGDQGDELLELSTATIRSVTVGVLGIAAIQAFLGGLGMYAVGIPATGIWTLVILILAVAQLPPWLVLGPMIVYVFSRETTAVSVVFMVWSLAVSFADMVLKPMLLGRGVKVPMLAILLGAIGGMITAGVMGLFVGAVVLALGYKLFESWLATGEADEGLAEIDQAQSAPDDAGQPG